MEYILEPTDSRGWRHLGSYAGHTQFSSDGFSAVATTGLETCTAIRTQTYYARGWWLVSSGIALALWRIHQPTASHFPASRAIGLLAGTAFHLGVLLRKADYACPGWSLIRPITIAGISYRIWSRVRTAQFMRHAKEISKPLVSPRLSTRAIWTFLSDLISRKVAAQGSLAGLVLDITKCFNILDRRLLRALMIHFGFPALVVDAWMAMLGQLNRTVLVEGSVYGKASSITGIPEGDPLSVAGMFTFAKAFDHLIQRRCLQVLCITYADNLELVARSSQELVRVLPVVERFLDLCQLLVAPSKCWFWAICPAARRRLQHTQLLGQKVPLKLQARELGADISYCKRKAAKERNPRATSGFRRMTKLHGLPGSIGRKTRLLLSGIFPHALHAAETSAAPKSVLQRLRSGAALAIDCRPKGASPWLACLLSTYRCVDPEFVLTMNRLQLFRQVIKELPDLAPFFMDNLSLDSPRPGPARLLVSSFHAVGWVHVGGGIFADENGRIFHVCLTPFSHASMLVLSTWTDKVASQVRHRKYLSELPNICVPISQVHKHLLPFEKKLILQQQVGAFFSGEYTKHIDAEASKCFHCGALDSRLHRLRWCPRIGPWRSLFPSLMRQWDELPEYLTAFGLVPEPDEWRRWQSTLDSLALPVIERSSCTETQVFYTDGACMYPRHQVVRVASGAALRAKADGTFEMAWCGVLPGACQSIFRAELLAVACAIGAYCLHGFKICLQSSCVQVSRQPSRRKTKTYGRSFLHHSVGPTSSVFRSIGSKATWITRTLLASPKFMHGSTIGPIWQQKRPFKDPSPLCTRQCCRTSNRKWL